mmetsp:Transcript_579/g.696  ORF Transcript_579/g.696 Transcript_579/m.696 type:complete len:277 (+) Transcript_579:83-913(+)|eukprot:CAMPEP_0204835258 /NCGR_PEP_ID=MMETSP1346-20131115/22016_1 /ASSEMBLY_ACC=CAM_ASM_000771 /TAXON_ID=215587 /ORGANISM="Aplanochytrium stocchinoi, Strain GSBS06" /LENGTH=276 /DNA_ID=CAMNT_0051969089 /DNA_START=194 /DNA_END=1024 /DNA_ORIENTATION=-
MSEQEQTEENCSFAKKSKLHEHQTPGSSHHHGHTHGHEHSHGHGHSHEVLAGPGLFVEREPPLNVVDETKRNFQERAFTVGIGGPVGSGKTALMLALCKYFRDKRQICSITNDIFTREDGEFLLRHEALEPDRIKAIETGGCPHAAIREDISANLQAAEDLTAQFHPEFILLESGGDNLAANFSRELADYIIYVIDVAGGDKVPRKGGPGVTQSDLLIVNKTDLAEAVGSSLEVMRRDARKMRGDGPTVFAQVKHGVAVDEIADHIIKALEKSVKK